MKKGIPGYLIPFYGPLTRRLHRRILFCFGLFCAGFSLLYLRIGLLGRSDELAQTAARQSRYTLTAVSERGMIYDRAMRPLVGEEEGEAYVVFPAPGNIQPVLQSLPKSRRESVLALLQRGTPFVLSDAELPAGLPGVYAFPCHRRYGETQLAPHLIGYLNNEGGGVTGIEKSYDELLAAAGRTVQLVCSLDGLQRPISGVEPEIRETGSGQGGVVLTLDKEVQAVIEEAGRAMLEKGAIVVMDPYSGEIHGLASFPDYDPHNLSASLADSENTPMINRALLPYSVGSTFKVATAAAALEEGADMAELIDCIGYVNVSGQIFRCHRRSGHGELDMLDAMKESCNPYFIHLGLEAGGKKLLDTAKRFGFGQKIPLADGITVSAGTLPSEGTLQSPAAVANLSFGQGELGASPVQIARMIATVVNGGYLVTPKLVVGETIDGSVVNRGAAPLKKRVLEAETAAQLQAFLIHCVMVSDGQNALPQTTTAGGKTATAQTGRFDEDGSELEHGWFAGFFPAVNPSYVVVVFSEDSGFGNDTAAPVFSQVADRILALG